MARIVKCALRKTGNRIGKGGTGGAKIHTSVIETFTPGVDNNPINPSEDAT